MKKSFFLFCLSIYFISSLQFFEIEIFNPNVSNGKISLEVDGKPTTTFPSKDSEYKIESITCSEGANGIWDDDSWSLKVSNLTNTKVKCQLSFSSIYHESILNGTDPVLKDPLIPVVIDADGTVHKASMYEKWYDYENQIWANAIILEDESISYQDGEVIPESNIESYFVWIPRYKYKIFNEGNYSGLTAVENRVQTIEVEFETKDVPVRNGSKVGEWLTHPAFQAFDVNGMWVGKFETGYKGATSTATAQVNSNDSAKIQVKPNVYSWRGVQIANAFTASFNYQRDLESHMMKNMEWGAVAYLQHSLYGSRSSVRINNNSSYITGYGALNEPTCEYIGSNSSCNQYEGTSLNVDGNATKRYNTSTGHLASTTSNISGIYDMSGGALEYVMGVMLDSSGNPSSGRSSSFHSGFNGSYSCPSCEGSGTSLTTGINFPEEKYYDKYDYATVSEKFDRRFLGDATGEMGPFELKTQWVGSWYADAVAFPYYKNPWFRRGDYYAAGTGAGVFAFSAVSGAIDPYVSYRIILSF